MSLKDKDMDKLDALYGAAQEYIESIGGKVIVIGGTKIQTWPGSSKHKFTLAIEVSGKIPPKPKPPTQ